MYVLTSISNVFGSSNDIDKILSDTHLTDKPTSRPDEGENSKTSSYSVERYYHTNPVLMLLKLKARDTNRNTDMH